MNLRSIRKVLIASSILMLVLSVVSTGIARSDSTDSASGKPIPELTWTSGEEFPVVDGRTIFPTLAPPISPPPEYMTHWYAGSVYPSGLPTQNAQTVYMRIKVPYSQPKSDEFYYVLLSAWDSAGSYDQIGFSNNYGTWGLTYSWTSGSPDNPTYHYTPNATALSLGVTYTFYITTVSGVTHFVAQNSTQVWSLDAPTGGNYLVLTEIYAGYYDYTNYEEVWQTSIPGGSPAFNFNFINNYWISTGGVAKATTWGAWSYGAPSNVAVIISGNDVFVDNLIGITISDFDSVFAANNVSLIYPSDSTTKPLSCGAASVSDWLASMAISTKLKNYTEGLDTESKFVNQGTGRAIGNTGAGIISFGGQYVNPVVKYAELNSTALADRAPIRFYYDSANDIFRFQYWNGTNIPGASLPHSVINQGEDMFVIETYKDANNRFVMLCYGFGWKGTYAAGKYFNIMIYPNLGSYSHSWIIVKWNDTNGDGFVNNPGDGDTYTIVAADPS